MLFSNIRPPPRPRVESLDFSDPPPPAQSTPAVPFAALSFRATPADLERSSRSAQAPERTRIVCRRLGRRDDP
jgi:hypothetical protein